MNCCVINKNGRYMQWVQVKCSQQTCLVLMSQNVVEYYVIRVL